MASHWLLVPMGLTFPAGSLIPTHTLINSPLSEFSVVEHFSVCAIYFLVEL